MQKRYKKEQQLQVHLEEVVEACYIKYATQKVRKVIKVKVKEKVKKQRLVEEKDKRKQLEYLQQLQNEVLVEDAVFLGSIEGSQAMRSKYKEVISKDKKRQQFFKKAKEK